MNRIRWTESAKADIHAIWRFVAVDRQSPINADRLLESLYSKVEFLVDFPLMGEVRNELSPGLRCFVAGSYVVFYRPLSDGILVERVLHGSQDVHRQF